MFIFREFAGLDRFADKLSVGKDDIIRSRGCFATKDKPSNVQKVEEAQENDIEILKDTQQQI